MVRYQELDDLEAALLTVWVRAGLWLQPDVASRLLVGLGFEGLHGGGSRSAHCGANGSSVLKQRGLGCARAAAGSVDVHRRQKRVCGC